ncbi:MAG: DUF3836 domain-containing protein [Prevotellaceae bacterium]|nr:DUF3836 domain-containing protein [Prevotellaceae bacterium]
METIITAATIMAMYLNSASNVNSPYCYNADIENGQVKTMYVYNVDGNSLSARLEYQYIYDDFGRLTSKTALKTDSFTGKKSPSYRLEYCYMADGYSVEHCKWNEKTESFDQANSRTEYRHVMDNVISVMNFEWDETKKDMLLVDNMLVMSSDNILMATNETFK